MNNFIYNEWSPLEKKLVISTFFLWGMVIGFLFAPIKKKFTAVIMKSISAPDFLIP